MATFKRTVGDALKTLERNRTLPIGHVALARPTLLEIFSHVEPWTDAPEDAIYGAHLLHRYPFSDIAGFLAIHRSTVSRHFERAARRHDRA